MDERKLTIFYEVAKKLNMTESAKSLYMSQPAISQAIKELEHSLDTKLFDRIGKSLYLTHEGEIFFNYTRRILNLHEEAFKTIRDINHSINGKLKIGASTTIGIYIMTDIIGDFIKQYKDVDISITIENTEHISHMVLENKIDFGFVEGPVSSNEIHVEHFCSDELIFILPNNHPWTKMNTLDPKLLENEKLIMREKGSGTREIVESILNSQHINYNVSLELGNIEAIKKAVIAGLGISCISKRCVTEEMKNNLLHCISINNFNILRDMTLIYHKDKYLSNLFYNFIDFAKKKV